MFLAGDGHDLASCRAGMMELDRDPAKIQAKHPQGNNLFVRREQCRAVARQSRAPLGSCSSRSCIPRGMRRQRWRGTALRGRGARAAASALPAASQLCDGSLKALIKALNPPPSLRPGGNKGRWKGLERAPAAGERAGLCPPCSGWHRRPRGAPATPQRGAGGVPGWSPAAPREPAAPRGCGHRCRVVHSARSEVVREAAGVMPARPCPGTAAGLGSPEPENAGGDAAGREVPAALPGGG